jgi:uncharacterized protein
MLTTLKVRVIPNARRSQVSAIGPDEVRVKVHAPAQQGKANAELIRFLSELFDCPKSRITLTKGEKNRNKMITVSGIRPEEVRRRLEAAYH